MSPQGKARTFRIPRHRKSPPKSDPAQSINPRKRRSSDADEEILRLVRAGVEKFIVNEATVDEFTRLIRSVADPEEPYSHPLTKTVFAKIVRAAIRKRKSRLSS